MVNAIDFVFINLGFAAIVTGVLINRFEKYIPDFIIKSYRYGSFAYKGSSAEFVEYFEVPKSYFRHFYVFSSIFSLVSLLYMIVVYYTGVKVNIIVVSSLKLLLQEDSHSVSAVAALLAMTLLVVQCMRRLYETCCLQVFAKSSKLNFTHYLAGFLHYLGCVITIAGQAPLFTGSLQFVSLDTYTAVLAMPCTVIFLSAWYEQYRSNIIFANLRLDKKSRKLVTEDHGVPFGRLFGLVSSPHRLSEVFMYTTLLILIPTRTFFYIYIWVLGNQVQTAIQAHEWYKKTFKSYPAERTAIFPHML